MLVNLDAGEVGLIYEVEALNHGWGKRELHPYGRWLVVQVASELTLEEIKPILCVPDAIPIEPDEPVGEDDDTPTQYEYLIRWRLNLSELDPEIVIGGFTTTGKIFLSGSTFYNACESRQGHRLDPEAQDGQGELRLGASDHSVEEPTISVSNQDVEELA